MKVFMVR